jgi:hypothetical protein
LLGESDNQGRAADHRTFEEHTECALLRSAPPQRDGVITAVGREHIRRSESTSDDRVGSVECTVKVDEVNTCPGMARGGMRSRASKLTKRAKGNALRSRVGEKLHVGLELSVIPVCSVPDFNVMT